MFISLVFLSVYMKLLQPIYRYCSILFALHEVFFITIYVSGDGLFKNFPFLAEMFNENSPTVKYFFIASILYLLYWRTFNIVQLEIGYSVT